MFKSLAIALAFFFVQPTFLFGALISWLNGRKRINDERKTLRVAVYKHLIESKEFFTGGLFIGLIISFFTVLLGTPVLLEWAVLYQLVTIVLFIFDYRFIHPMFTFSLSGLFLLGYVKYFPTLTIPSVSAFGYTLFGERVNFEYEHVQSLLVFVCLLVIATAVKLVKSDQLILSPRFMKTKRGKLVASYQMKPMWLVPLLLIVPGNAFQAFFSWWPVFTIGTDTYTFFMLPVLIGLRYTLKTQLPEDAASKLSRELLFVAGISILSLVGSFWYPVVGVIGLGLLVITGFATLYRHRLRERSWHFVYAPEENGWKVVGVRPDTPGDKMDLRIGDTILECNQLTKEKVDTFYEAIEVNRVYCKMRVKRADGEIVLAETAIYDHSPHDLGIIVVEDGEKIV